MKSLVWLLFLCSSAALASDPASSSYRHTRIGKSDAELEALRAMQLSNENAQVAMITQDVQQLETATRQELVAKAKYAELQAEDCQKESGNDADRWTWFTFCKADNVIGGMAVAKNGDTNSVTFNAINYYLLLGGTLKLPFQLLLNATEDPKDDPEAIKDKNEAVLLDAESGYALRIPIYWIYNPATGFCAFGAASVGSCTAGADVTLSAKQLTDVDGEAKSAFSGIVRAGASALFPITDAITSAKNGYLAIDIKVAYAYANHSYDLQLFAPVTDASGEPVEFKKQISYSEFGVKLAIDGRVSIAARWMMPFTGKEYLSDRSSVIIEMQF